MRGSGGRPAGRPASLGIGREAIGTQNACVPARVVQPDANPRSTTRGFYTNNTFDTFDGNNTIKNFLNCQNFGRCKGAR